MQLQVIKDGYGNNTGIFVPMNDWDTITQMHQDLKTLVNIEPTPKKKLSELAGKLSKDTADQMLKELEQSRNEWEERLNKQF
jgi:capsular polysaccharide biosynthesis protein